MAQRISHWTIVIIVDSGNLSNRLREGIIPFSSALMWLYLELSGTSRGWELTRDWDQWGLSQGGRVRPGSQSCPITPARSRADWGQLRAAPALGTSLGTGEVSSLTVVSPQRCLAVSAHSLQEGAGPEPQQPNFQEWGYSQTLDICVQFCTCLPV